MHSTRPGAVRWVATVPLLAAAVAACGGGAAPEPITDPKARSQAADGPSGPPAPAGPDGEAERAAAATPPSPDQLAGLRSRDVPDAGDGQLVVVPGVTSAPAGGELRQVRVAVEGGLDVDGGAFADLVMATLNDPRGWSNEGFTFARTDTDGYDVEVVLGSPDTSSRLCEPLQTFGTLSCRSGDRAVLTLARWVDGTDDYAQDLTAYRQYVVQHEVGHALGKDHVACPAPGEVAPVMMQQTKGLDGCLPNPWPYP